MSFLHVPFLSPTLEVLGNKLLVHLFLLLQSLHHVCTHVLPLTPCSPFTVPLLQGNKRTPEKFVGREAIITSQCLNGW